MAIDALKVVQKYRGIDTFDEILGNNEKEKLK